MIAVRETASILPLVVENISFSTGRDTHLENISFHLPVGGATVVLGPNGAGKSLLLRICHGLIAPASGAVKWALPGGLAGGVRRHAMVFQRPLMLRRSARANLHHALAAIGMPRNERGARAEEAFRRFGLEDIAERPARLLSGGEQQRLAIARAWSLSPEVIFLDEPTSQLDPGAARQVEAMIAALEQEGVTILMTTHDLGQAHRLARHVMFLNRGRLVERGPADSFFNAPSTPEARAFLAGELLW